MNLAGKVSWFGGPGDPSDSGHTATGGTTREPGIAVYNHNTLGGYWRVKAPNGKTAVLRQTDIGPAPWTGRKIDVTYSALGRFGFNEKNFPTDSTFQAEYLGKNAPSPQAQAAAAPPMQQQRTIPGTPATQVSEVDQGALRKAQTDTAIARLFSPKEKAGNPLFATGILSTREPSPESFVKQRTIPGTPEQKTPVQPAIGTHIGAALPKGLAKFEGKEVAGWINPILQWARTHGWKGSVQSGFRSRAEQERIYNSGVRPAAVPGTSNHEGTDFPRGAVDVSEAAQLARVLQHSPYAGTLVWAGAKDPPHFSFPHGGSY